MINAGFEVFSCYPYAKAPMSEIAAAGGVSKSLLFHYFDNKLGLYLFLWETALGEIARSTQVFNVVEADDLFELLRRATAAKCRVMRTHPRLFAFATRAYYEEQPDVKAAIGVRVEAALSNAAAMVARMGDAGLRDGVSAEDIYDDFILLSEGYMAQRYRAGRIDVDEIEHDFGTIIMRWRAALARERA
ncbi:TetR/AcrR family transcriptional regulator [Actinomyces sp. MRS3W]|uniref:TetR/AcrR family transcriptional regulator n=1 Tax=Actinomyces sp. MRS3W TaxID=2800796 RepID=UPI002905CA8C|nr:TetR/AcrR family transcriptional regulator [Actinomyces sp. MRS3W]